MEVTVNIRIDPQELLDGAHIPREIGEPAATLVQNPSTPSLADALERYLTSYMAARNLAQRTRLEYRADIEQAITFLTRQCGVVDAAAVEPCHLESFLAELDHRGLAGASRRRKLASLRSFFRYLHDADLIQRNPASKLATPARERGHRRALSETEYEALRCVCAHDARNAAIVEVFLQTGIRLSEAAALRLCDLDLSQPETSRPGAIIVHGKGRKERVITLNGKASHAVRQWLAVRPHVGSDCLFLSRFGHSLGARGIQHVVTTQLRKAGIANASTHSLRHTFATHSAKKGTKLAVLQGALGHESLATTSIYVEMAREQMDQELQANAL